MLRRAARIDANQPAIVQGLRKAGCTVQSLAAIGKGCPDIIVGLRGVNYLMEIKDGDKVPSQRKLTPDEKEWIEKWRGQVAVVNSLEEALKIIGLIA